MQKGTVKWFDVKKGYGFITPADGTSDVFVHHSAIEMKGYRELKDGEAVEFEARPGPKGLSATTVRRG